METETVGIPTINVSAVTAVRLGDGWHTVTDFSFFGDGESDVITMAGAAWRELNGCRFSCTLRSVLAVREGIPAAGPAESPSGQTEVARNQMIQDWLISWLSQQKAQAAFAKTVFAAAEELKDIKRDALKRVSAEMIQAGIISKVQTAKGWLWQLVPTMNASSSDEEIFIVE